MSVRRKTRPKARTSVVVMRSGTGMLRKQQRQIANAASIRPMNASELSRSGCRVQVAIQIDSRAMPARHAGANRLSTALL